MRNLALLALCALVALTASAEDAVAKANTPVAREAFNDKLGVAILTTTSGRTLYSLSAEVNGRFICTDRGCLSSWRPLIVPAGAKPAGPVALGTVKRPGGQLQVTYGGRPLYAFAHDKAPGQARGEDIRDVGTWHAAVVSRRPR